MTRCPPGEDLSVKEGRLHLLRGNFAVQLYFKIRNDENNDENTTFADVYGTHCPYHFVFSKQVMVTGSR